MTGRSPRSNRTSEGVSHSVLPSPSVYEQEYEYWPWGALLKRTSEWVVDNSPEGAVVLDYMYGTGYLLNQVGGRRTDLRVFGCSLTPSFIQHANENYHRISVALADALQYLPTELPDVVLCTAGLHHLPPAKQELLIDKIASELRDGGHFLLGEEIVRPHSTETDRKRAVLELWQHVLSYVIAKEAPREVLDAALAVLRADLFYEGEYKRSDPELLSMLQPYFDVVERIQTWPAPEQPFGDVLYICKRRDPIQG